MINNDSDLNTLVSAPNHCQIKSIKINVEQSKNFGCPVTKSITIDEPDELKSLYQQNKKLGEFPINYDKKISNSLLIDSQTIVIEDQPEEPNFKIQKELSKCLYQSDYALVFPPKKLLWKK
jgi:hypothetical protein